MHPMMSYKGNAHFPKSLMSSFCSLKWQVSKPGYVCWNCKKSSYRRVLIHIQTFSLYATLSSSPHKNPSNTFDGFLLPSRKSVKIFWRICDDGSLLFTFLGSTPHNSELLYNKNHILPFTQRIFASEDSRTGGFIAAKIFPRGDLCPKKTLWPRTILSKKMSLHKSHCSNRHFCKKRTPCLAEVHVVWARCWDIRIQLLG